MQRLFLGALLISATHTALAAQPQHGYVGIMLSKFGYDASSTQDGEEYDLEADPDAFVVRLGYQVSEIVSVEARYGSGTSDDTLAVDDEESNADLGIDTYYGGFIRAHFPNKTPVSPYLIAGYNKIEIELENSVTSVDDDDTDLAMGLGVDFVIENFALNVEYLEAYNKNDTAGDALSFGATLSF